MGKNELAMMKDGALFINTARGALADRDALYKELAAGRLKACLDVYLEMGEAIAADLERYFSGQEPMNRVDPARLAITA